MSHFPGDSDQAEESQRIVDQEGRIFEVGKQPQVQNQAGRQDALPKPRAICALHRVGEKIIHDGRDHQ